MSKNIFAVALKWVLGPNLTDLYLKIIAEHDDFFLYQSWSKILKSALI